MRDKISNKKLETQKMSSTNLNLIKSKSFSNNYNKNNDNIKDMVDNKNLKIKKNLRQII